MLSVARRSPVCPHNDEVNFEFLVPILAAATSAVGILVALDQITALARLRRQVSFWNGLRMNKPRPADAEAIQSLERAATAKIIAFQALPAWRLLFPAFAFLTGISTAWQSGYVAGRIPPPELSWDKFQISAFEEGLEVPFLLGVPVVVAMGLYGWINVLLERSRLSKAYLEGQTLERQEVSTQSNRQPASAVLGGRGSAAVWTCSLGVSCLAAFFGAATGMRDVNGPLPWPDWMGILMMGGVFASMTGFLSTLGLLTKSRPLGDTQDPWILGLGDLLTSRDGASLEAQAQKNIALAFSGIGDKRFVRVAARDNGKKQGRRLCAGPV